MTDFRRLLKRTGACAIVFLILLLSILGTKWVVDLVSYRLLWHALKWTLLVIMVSIVFGSFHYSKDCFIDYMKTRKK